MTASLVPTSPEDGNFQPNRREAQFASPLALYEGSRGDNRYDMLIMLGDHHTVTIRIMHDELA
jgi:hypothetical protein